MGPWGSGWPWRGPPGEDAWGPLLGFLALESQKMPSEAARLKSGQLSCISTRHGALACALVHSQATFCRGTQTDGRCKLRGGREPTREQKGWASSQSPDRQPGQARAGPGCWMAGRGVLHSLHLEGQRDGTGLPPDLLCSLREAASLSGTHPDPGTIRDSDRGHGGNNGALEGPPPTLCLAVRGGSGSGPGLSWVHTQEGRVQLASRWEGSEGLVSWPGKGKMSPGDHGWGAL